MGLADFIKVYRFLRGIRYPATKQQLVDGIPLALGVVAQ